MTAEDIAAFAFRAQSAGGDAVTGTINAATVAEASRQLHALQLRAIELDPVRAEPRRSKPLTGDDFQAFNMQLAHLATAGLPVEKSLRLIAQDMRSGAMAASVNQVAADLESGRSLPEAFAKHASQFPPLYSEMLGAGIRTGNLPGMLLSLGRHLDLVKRLRGMIWRSASYPIMVMVSLMGVISFLGIFVLPQFNNIFREFKVELPAITQFALNLSEFLVSYWPILLGIIILLFVGLPLLLRLQPPLIQQKIKETLLFPIPIIGPAMRRNLLARWCDALKLGVEAGMDLPAAITMAGQAIGSPRLIADGAILVQAINAGQPLAESAHTRLIPPTVTTVIALAADKNDLPSGLNTLGEMFQQQAEMQIAMIPTVLTPVLIMLIAVVIGFVVIAMFAPMIALISSVSGPSKN
jgi:type II secretory pathway component PulF